MLVVSHFRHDLTQKLNLRRAVNSQTAQALVVVAVWHGLMPVQSAA